MMSLARPKSQIFTSFPSQMRTFLAARSRCTHCRERQGTERGTQTAQGSSPAPALAHFCGCRDRSLLTSLEVSPPPLGTTMVQSHWLWPLDVTPLQSLNVESWQLVFCAPWASTDQALFGIITSGCRQRARNFPQHVIHTIPTLSLIPTLCAVSHGEPVLLPALG